MTRLKFNLFFLCFFSSHCYATRSQNNPSALFYKANKRKPKVFDLNQIFYNEKTKNQFQNIRANNFTSKNQLNKEKSLDDIFLKGKIEQTLHQNSKKFMFLTTGLLFSYIQPSYAATLMREVFPYVWTAVYGNSPDQMGWFQYMTLYIPFREEAVQWAFNHPQEIIIGGYLCFEALKKTISTICHGCLLAVKSKKNTLDKKNL